MGSPSSCPRAIPCLPTLLKLSQELSHLCQYMQRAVRVLRPLPSSALAGSSTPHGAPTRVVVVQACSILPTAPIGRHSSMHARFPRPHSSTEGTAIAVSKQGAGTMQTAPPADKRRRQGRWEEKDGGWNPETLREVGGWRGGKARGSTCTEHARPKQQSPEVTLKFGKT